MNILYIITILAIYILFIMMYKTEKKQNISAWIVITAILILCYNILICLICTFIGILCTLQNLTICNSIMLLVLTAIILKNKKIQKYYIKISDIVFAILSFILVIFIAYKQYGFPFNIKYKTTDGSNHYFLAQQFFEKSSLLYNEETKDIMDISNLGFKLPGAYVNEGILFKIFDVQVEKTDLFIIFDLVVLYMSGILFYHLLNTYSKEKKKLRLIAAIFSIIYMLGYQLNSMLYGYVYLSLALDIVIALLLLMRICKKEQINDTIALPILAFLSFGIFFSYAYFIPIIYIAIISYIIIEAKMKKEKILSEDNLIKAMFLIIEPLILGATYFIVLPLTKGIKTEISSIIVDGAIYKNYISNLLVFIPIFIMGIIVFIKSKKKQNDFSTILFILSILFAIILFIGNKLGKVSSYYFFKAYYIIWPLAIINIYIVLSNVLEQENKILRIVTYIYTSMYVIAIIFATLILQRNIGINNIFYNNTDIVINEGYILNNTELEILKKAKQQIENNEIYILPGKTMGRKKWIIALHENENIFFEQVFNDRMTVAKWIEKNGSKYYLAYYKDYNKIEEEPIDLEQNNDKYKIIHNDEYGFILKRK